MLNLEGEDVAKTLKSCHRLKKDAVPTLLSFNPPPRRSQDHRSAVGAPRRWEYEAKKPKKLELSILEVERKLLQELEQAW